MTRDRVERTNMVVLSRRDVPSGLTEVRFLSLIAAGWFGRAAARPGIAASDQHRFLEMARVYSAAAKWGTRPRRVLAPLAEETVRVLVACRAMRYRPGCIEIFDPELWLDL